MHCPVTDIQADFEINWPVRYRNTAKRNYFHRRTDSTRSFFSKKGKTTKKETVATSFSNGNVTIPLLPSVTNLGAKIDNRCAMEKHALNMCTNACLHLQSIRKIRRWKAVKYWCIHLSQADWTMQTSC